MDVVTRYTAGLRLLLRRHSLRVWLLWLLALAVLIATPFAFFDPAAWLFALDPELAALVVLMGVATVRSGALRVLRRAR